MGSHQAVDVWVVLVCGLGEDPHEQQSTHSFKYGWDEFCASNHLNVGDTCFFSMIHEATCSNDNDEEWEELEDDEAKLKVEVHKTNDRWRR